MALTKNDLLKISFIVTKVVNEELKSKFDEAFRLLPSKEDFFSRMDNLSGEYKKIDETQTMQLNQLSEHEDKLEKHDHRISALEQHSDSTPV